MGKIKLLAEVNSIDWWVLLNMAGIRVVKGNVGRDRREIDGEGFEYYEILRVYAVIDEVDFLTLITMWDCQPLLNRCKRMIFPKCSLSEYESLGNGSFWRENMSIKVVLIVIISTTFLKFVW